MIDLTGMITITIPLLFFPNELLTVVPQNYFGTVSLFKVIHTYQIYVYFD